MPDWTYHPVLRPIGTALHGRRAREVALQRLTAIGSVRAGRWLVRWMGDTVPDDALAVVAGPIRFRSPVILAASIDPDGTAMPLLSQLGFGGIELAEGTDVPIGADLLEGVVVIGRFAEGCRGAADVVRCGPDDIEAARRSGAALVMADVGGASTAPSLLALGAQALVVDRATIQEARAEVERVRARVGPDAVVVGGSITSPRDALVLRDAGADLVLVGEGLATAGPGIAKRTNELLLGALGPPERPPSPRAWGRVVSFGAGVSIASLVATWVASTDVIMGYDERFVGMRRAALQQVDAHLLDFMAHDRLSYAGATLSLGILYTALAVAGLRWGCRWAYRTLVASGVAGFATFLLYFGFGYFDIGNAAVTAVLLPAFLLAVVGRPKLGATPNDLDLDNDPVWRRALVGQLLLVALGVGLVIGGAAICVVGVTKVFVVSDLAFLGTTSEHLRSASSQLLPLIAHDRASFGGAIVANGIAVLLSAMWGFRRGARWLWWTWLVAGTINLGFVLYAHLSTSYTEIGHLLPVAVGGAFFVAGLVLSRPFLLDRGDGAGS